MTAFVDMLHRDQYALKCALGDTKKILPLLKERGQTHYAVANYGEISNWVEQLFTCKNSGIVPILGMEAYVNNYRVRGTSEKVADIQVEDLTTGTISSLSALTSVERDLVTQDYPIALYARTVEGYYNIIQIHNDAQLYGVDKRPRTSDAFLKEHGRGVAAILPTPYSEVSALACSGLWRDAIQQYRLYESVFDCVYVAVTLVEKPEYREINDEVIRFCRHYGIPFVPVLNSHYISPDDHEAFLTVRELARLRGGISYEIEACPGMYYRTLEETDALYEKVLKSETFTPEAYAEAKGRLTELVSSFTLLDLDYDLKLPHFSDGAKRLREKAWAGFLRKGYDKMGKEYLDRFNYELDNIVGAGFADYFLVLEELYSWYAAQGHVTPLGRGSAAGSLVLNCIGGTGLDPIKHHLLFERFLDAERFRMIVEKGGKVQGCFPKDTVVPVREGYRFIQDICVGDEVVSMDGAFRKVLAIYRHLNKEFLKVKYAVDGETYFFLTTENHIFPYRNGDVVGDKPIGKFVDGDELMVSEDIFSKIVEISNSGLISTGYDLKIEGLSYYRVCGVRC